jgi:hypothetical protein
LYFDESLLRILDDASRAFAKEPPGFGQLDAAWIADEQRRADFALEFEDLLAQRRLGDPQVGRRIREMQMLGHRKEVTQLTKFHIFFVSKK